jgi:hypothetical protein
MGLTVPDTKPTTSTPPKTTVLVTKIDSSIIMRLTMHYKDSEIEARGKPYEIHGAEMRYVISPTAPKTIGELIHSEFSTRSPLTREFDENQRGQIFWFRFRWENMRGQKGPWSELYSAIIP